MTSVIRPFSAPTSDHLPLALAAAELGTWEWDIPHGRVYWSPELERIHGIPEGTFPGTFDGYQRDIHPDDRARVLSTIERSLKERQPHRLDYRIVRPDGSVRWLQAQGRLLADDSGAPARLIGICMDVTEQREREGAAEASRRRAEADLAEQMRLALLARDIGLALTQTADQREMLQQCAQMVVNHLGAAFARIWTLNEAEQILELQASAGQYTHLDGPHGRVPVGRFKIGRIAEERTPHLTNTVERDPRVSDLEWARREGMVAFAGYPLTVGDRLLGVLAMFARHRLSQVDFDALATVANALAVGLARARADAILRDSEERYRFLAEAAPVQVWTASSGGVIDFANSVSLEYFGVDIARLPEEGQQALVHADDWPVVSSGWADALRTGAPLEAECRLRRHDGAFRWHLMRARAYRDGHGRLAKWFGTSTDIDEQKEARLALASRAEQLARLAGELQYQRDLTTTITDNAASALFMMDRNGYPIFMNPAARAMTGYSGVDEIRDRPLHDAIHFRKPDGSPYPMEECPIDRANAEIVALRAQREIFCRRDGALFPVEYNVAPIVRGGERQGAVIEVRDITADLEAQRALRESDERFHLLARATNDTIWDWNLDTHVVWWSEALERTFGYARGEVGDKPESWTARVHPDDRDRVAGSLTLAFEGGHDSWAGEYRFRRADGSYADIFDRAIIVRDDRGRARRAIGSMMEVTERKRAEVALRRHAEDLAGLALALQRSNEELDQFAYVASHDLKAPLRGIANLSQWIEEDLGEAVNDSARGQLVLLRNRVHRMEALIDGILQYSRAGRAPAAVETVAVRRVVTDVLDLLQPPQHLQIEVAPDLPVLTTERLPLQQVFLNLIGNALKHAGGVPAPRIEVSRCDVTDGPAFTVTDNGPGIAPAFHERVWGIFQTLQPRDKVEGTGIGLALVRKIVQARGGRVWLDSAEGAGATFGFTWPAKPAERT